jgi:translocation and assembly module TamB
MSRPMKIFRNIAIGLGALAFVLAVAALIVSQTDWFRNYVKNTIITSTEDSIGGKVEVASFRFDARHLHVDVSDFVIHGNEPSGAAPFVRVAKVQLDIRLFTSIHHFLDVAYLGVEHPEVNVLVLPDGRTNIPTPRKKSESKQTPLETVVDLAVGRFELTNGLLALASQKQNLNIRGNNLRAQLWYNVLNQGYNGELVFQPLYVASGRNTPVNFTVTLPVALERDRIDFHQARITTAQSALLIDGSIEDIRNPKVSAHVNGHLALADLKNAGNLPLAIESRNAPSTADLDANVTLAGNSIQVTGLRLGLGQSTIEASGPLMTPNGQGGLQFKSRLSLAELGRLARVAARPDGIVLLNGTAKLDANNNYQITGNIQAANLSFQQQGQRISNINLYSALDLDSHMLELKGLRLAAFGGELVGNVSLENFARYRVDASLRNFDIRAAARSLGQKQLPYDGIVSGPIEASGDLNAPSTSSLAADARLSIAPGKSGIPVSGRLYAAYNGATNDIRIQNSFVALPHSRLTLDGSAGKQLNVALTSTNLNDLLAAASMASNPPVALNGGQASFIGAVTGNLAAPRISGHLDVNRFSVEGRQFDQFSADASASSTGASIRNASLTRGTMQMQASASVGLRNWMALPNQPLSANAVIRNGDVADLVALAGRASTGYSGMLSANLAVAGTVGNPRGGAGLLVTNGMIDGEPFDHLQAQVKAVDQLVTISDAFIESGPARVNLSGKFDHPRDSFITGSLEAHVDSNRVNLEQLTALQKQKPNTAGVVQLNANVSGSLSQVKNAGKQEAEFLLTSINADASVRGLHAENQDYGDLNLTAHTSGKTVRYNLNSNFAGSNIRVNGNTQLVRGYPTNADANLNNLPVQRVLAVAHRTDLPAKGNLSGTAHFSGTTENPQGDVDLDLANAVLYDEPIDHVRARATYLAQSIDVPQLQIAAGPSRIDLNARYDHPSGNFQLGHVQFRVNSSKLDLSRIKNLQERRPGLGGTLQLTANGAADIRQNEPRVMLHDLDADVKATGLAAQGKKFGDLTLTANTSAGRVNFALDSNMADATIHGRGNAQLTTNYPVDAELTFSNVAWTRIQPLMRSENAQSSFDATAEGQIAIRGPVMKTDELSGSLQVTHLQVTSISRAQRAANTVLLQNQGPIAATLDRGVVRIASAHVSGPQTDLQATGTIPLRNQPMDVVLNGNLSLAILRDFNRDVTSSGSVVLATTVRGTMTSPLMNGRLEVHNASVNYAAVPNGISKANGVILFSGNSASIGNLTAESGGGKVTLAGFAAMSGNVRFGLKADASNVRVLVNQGASIVTDSNITLNGTTDGSVLSGTVTINRVTYAPQTDIGAMLTSAGPPVQVATVPSPLLDNMKLDIQVRNSDALAVQAALAENLQLDANLRVRGTVTHPGLLGRITVTQGKLVFFGSSYTVNTGTIAFYNPVRVEPILDLSLETQAKGVDVVLRVTGPVDNMKLSYTSDPPLQFQEIVTLLAAGKIPTSDPTLLANQPSPPPQSFQQMGESALVSHALADPVASRLERVFGVSELKIDPTFTSGSQLPQAQLTLQQRVADNITFTYVTALNNTNAQTIEVQVTLNPQWSATATRDYNGIFSINLLYKKQFR